MNLARLTDEERCNCMDSGVFNDIISGYIALAFKAAGFVPGKEKVSCFSLLDTYSAADAIREYRYGAKT